jgi:hypothetical protein
MMTDDLRQECEAFASNQGWLDYHEETNELLDEHGIVDALMAFARAQQAKGLREAAEECTQRQSNCQKILDTQGYRRFLPGELAAWRANADLLRRFSEWLEARATAREKGEV